MKILTDIKISKNKIDITLFFKEDFIPVSVFS